jgi:hypothetical protein
MNYEFFYRRLAGFAGIAFHRWFSWLCQRCFSSHSLGVADFLGVVAISPDYLRS